VIIGFHHLSADMDDKCLSVVFFIELNWHFVLL
jgi:hypothetical protein